MALRLKTRLCLASRLLLRASNSGFRRRQASRLFSEYITKTYGSPQGISVNLLLEDVKKAGLWYENDARLSSLVDAKKATETGYLNEDQFTSIAGPCLPLVEKAVTGQLVIPDFLEFTKQIDTIYSSGAEISGGKLADYIPLLASVDPSFWGVSLCTVDGQRYDCGDAKERFSIQSAGKAFNYGILNDLIGRDNLHKFVGKEPSGLKFNEIALDSEGRPHNPLINSGSLLLCALHAPSSSSADRINQMLKIYKRLCGGETLSVSMPIYSSEKDHADRNYALAYFLKENKCFPPNTQLESILNYYFQLCSIEITCQNGAVMAGTLANAGVCPITMDKVYSQPAVRDTLALMHTCGMYDLSGKFSFNVGLPAKSGVSGAIIVVVPDILGLCLYGPLIDRFGNSVKGVAFCEKLVETFHYHIYDSNKRFKL
ncbi:putative glutaminase 2 [Dysidea avara]|uniref:putative glutaminase 2 n=1 Tax=Dysidea avara TaxID=196820 RepID=UPI00332BF04D